MASNTNYAIYNWCASRWAIQQCYHMKRKVINCVWANMIYVYSERFPYGSVGYLAWKELFGINNVVRVPWIKDKRDIFTQHTSCRRLYQEVFLVRVCLYTHIYIHIHICMYIEYTTDPVVQCSQIQPIKWSVHLAGFHAGDQWSSAGPYMMVLSNGSPCELHWIFRARSAHQRIFYIYKYRERNRTPFALRGRSQEIK